MYKSMFLAVLLLWVAFSQNVSCDGSCIDYISCMAKGNFCEETGNYSVAAHLFEQAGDYITLGSGQELEKALLYVRAADLIRTENVSYAIKLYNKALGILSEYGYEDYADDTRKKIDSLTTTKFIIPSRFEYPILEEKKFTPYPFITFVMILVFGGAAILLFKLSSKNKKTRETKESTNS